MVLNVTQMVLNDYQIFLAKPNRLRMTLKLSQKNLQQESLADTVKTKKLPTDTRVCAVDLWSALKKIGY